MTLESHQRQRLEFLCRVTQKEVNHLLDTDRRLFADLFTLEVAQQLEPMRCCLSASMPL